MIGNCSLNRSRSFICSLGQNPFCLTWSNLILSNSWFKYLKSSLFKYLTELSKKNVFILFIIYSNLFGITLILRFNFPSSCIIRRESYFFRLWNTIGIFWLNLRLILQSLCAGLLYFSVMWQWPLTWTSVSI